MPRHASAPSDVSMMENILKGKVMETLSEIARPEPVKFSIHCVLLFGLVFTRVGKVVRVGKTLAFASSK